MKVSPQLARPKIPDPEIMMASASQGGPVHRELEQILEAGERNSAIAGQLLAYHGSTDLQVRPVALNRLVESVLPRLQQLFGRGIEIIADLSPDMAPVMADPVQLRQIILKLAANSREAMESGGTFCLQTASTNTVEPGLGSAGTDGGPYGMLAVSDSGPGFDDQSWAHLFEPFFSTKADGRSLGLGLAAVYGLVRQSGGKLWAHSQPGRGATFRIYLPTTSHSNGMVLRPRGRADARQAL